MKNLEALTKAELIRRIEIAESCLQGMVRNNAQYAKDASRLYRKTKSFESLRDKHKYFMCARAYNYGRKLLRGDYK